MSDHSILTIGPQAGLTYSQRKSVQRNPVSIHSVPRSGFVSTQGIVLALLCGKAGLETRCIVHVKSSLAGGALLGRGEARH